MSEKKKKKSPAKADKKVELLQASDIKQLSSSNKVPSQLQIYVSQEIWNMWSPIRRDSFSQIIKNPNTFFYRNRPPGDPQRTGPFTDEEEKQFLERLHYFRDILGIDGGQWGLFAVPIRGRLGYQCANFYRNLIAQGKIKDDKYKIIDGKLDFIHGQKKNVDDSVIKLLTKEALSFIEECLQSEDGATPKMSKPVRVAPPVRTTTKEKSDAKQKTTTEDILGSSCGKNPKTRRTHRSYYGDTENNSPLVGAIDPLSARPIKTPMMDEVGYVMDLSSWRSCIKGQKSFPFPTPTTSEEDLMEITDRNFHNFRDMIINIPC